MEQSDQDLQCLLRHVCPNILGKYDIYLQDINNLLLSLGDRLYRFFSLICFKFWCTLSFGVYSSCPEFVCVT